MDNNFDDFMNNDFNFKPITSGLGFHDKKDFEATDSDIKARANELKRDLEEAETRSNLHASDLDLGDLAPFYGKETIKQTINLENIEPENLDAYEAIELNAPIFMRFFAWTLDFAVVCLTFVAALTLITIGSGVTFEFVARPNVLEMLLLNTFPIFLMIYVFYFSFLDRTSLSTVGKNLLNLRLVSHAGEKTRYTTSLLRATLQLVGVFTLGFTNLLDIPGRVTNTKIVSL